MLKDEAKDEAKRQASWLNHPAFLWGVGLCLPLLCALLNVWLGAVLLLVNVAIAAYIQRTLPRSSPFWTVNLATIIMLLMLNNIAIFGYQTFFLDGQNTAIGLIMFGYLPMMSAIIDTYGATNEKRVYVITAGAAVAMFVAAAAAPILLGKSEVEANIANISSTMGVILFVVLALLFKRVGNKITPPQPPTQMPSDKSPLRLERQQRVAQQVNDWRTGKREKMGSDLDIQPPNDRA